MRNLSRVAVIIFLFFIFLPVKSILAADPALLIVEVQIAGGSNKSDNDFIKIYNPGDNDLDISGYKLRKRTSTGSESSVRVFQNGSKILAKGYFLWANSKDDFHLTVGADVWSTAYLAKNNSIALLDQENVTLDALAWGESQNPFVEGIPFLENPGANQQLKRKVLNGVYQNTNNNGQDFYLYPPSEPSQPQTETIPKEETRPESQLQSSTEPESIIYPSGIIINEILPNTPLGITDEEGEYIEIFNQNNFEVDLSDWKIEDTAGRTTTYTFPKGTKIGSLGFLLFPRPTTKITLNNDGDGLNLIRPDGKIANVTNYEKAPRGQSYNKTSSGWTWSTILSPGSENIIPVQETEKTEPLEEIEKIDINSAPLEDLIKIVHIGEIRAEELISLRPFYSLEDLTRISGIGQKSLEDIKKQGLAWIDPKLTPTEIEETELFEKDSEGIISQPYGASLAAASEPLGKNLKSLSVFLIASALAIFSGMIILALKKKIKSVDFFKKME